jgi:hypothetical protein
VKRLVAFTVALVLGAAAAHAQTAPTTDQNTAKKLARVSGTVRSATLELVVVAARDKGEDAEWTFAVEPVTPIRKGNKSITARDIKAGDVVVVRFVERDGKALVQSILVRVPTKKAEK